MRVAGRGLQLYHASGLKRLLPMRNLDDLTPAAETPFFFREIGKVYPAEGERRYRVAFLAGCIANIAFARLNEATVRVLRKNGCEVAIPAGQGCCGALHLHAGLAGTARKLASRNLDAFLREPYDAIITNAAGCGSTLKEYGDLLRGDPRAAKFAALVRDVNEFLAAVGVRPPGAVRAVVTYQDSCHLAHGQKVRTAPRQLLAAVPGLEFRELPLADLCCGSAGTYNITHPDIASSLLEKKMAAVNGTGATIVATANPGCMLQLRAGVARHGRGQRVMHVVEILDEAYR
jgi:glycolate oxidase iron-sulfur subunit